MTPFNRLYKMILYLILLLHSYKVSASCSFTQNCEGPDCDLLTPLSPFKEPKLHTFTQDIMCPEFAGMPTCCNNLQNNKMNELYKLIDMTLGHFAGGCDVCAANMKRLWCHIVCSPEQSSFVTAFKPETAESSNSDALHISCNLQEKTAIDLYSSCKDSPHLQKIGMRNYEEFLKIIGDRSVALSHAITSFEYSDSGLGLDLASCGVESEILYGYNIEPCKCLK
jgi:hypothetical protein